MLTRIKNRLGLTDEKPTLYGDIENLEITCDNHGELGPNDLGISVGGLLVCKYCSLNEHMDTENRFDIDPRPNIDF